MFGKTGMAVIVAVIWIATGCAEQRSGEQETAGEVAGLDVSAVSVSGQIPDDLRRALDERTEAVYQVNADAWDRLTADGFTVVRADGRVMNKAERLAEMRTQTPVSVPALEEELIQNYGDVVVRRLRSGDVWVLEVWMRGQGGWQVSITQLTPR